MLYTNFCLSCYHTILISSSLSTQKTGSSKFPEEGFRGNACAKILIDIIQWISIEMDTFDRYLSNVMTYFVHVQLFFLKNRQTARQKPRQRAWSTSSMSWQTCFRYVHTCNKNHMFRVCMNLFFLFPYSTLPSCNIWYNCEWDWMTYIHTYEKR